MKNGDIVFYEGEKVKIDTVNKYSGSFDIKGINGSKLHIVDVPIYKLSKKDIKYYEQNNKCPICNSDLIILYGAYWDYDQVFCSNRSCKFDIELDSSTLVEDEI